MKRPEISASRNFTGILRVALAAVIWGAAYPLTKGALNQVPPIILGFGRFFLAACGMMIISKSLPLNGIASNDKRKMFILAFWGAFILVLSINFGLRWAPAVVASIISGTPPLFTVLFAALWLGESIEKRKIIALIMAFGGILLLAGPIEGASASWLPIIGSILVIVPQVAWAIYGVLGKSIISKYPWKLICRDTFALGAIMLAPFAAIEGAIHGLGTWNQTTVFVLIYLALFNSIVTYGLWNRALEDVPVSTASLVLYLQPVSGAIISMLFWNESLGMTGWIGAILIFLALRLTLV